MKILVIGLGSMGKRRILNLKELGRFEIFGFDTREDRRQEASRRLRIKTISRIHDAIETKPDAIIISTPPDSHLEYAKLAIKNKINFFMELNHSYKDLQKIIKALKGKKILAASSCTMLYHPMVKRIKQILEKNDIGKVLHVYHHFGHYLPLWHPWENYKEFFVSKKETGGAKELVPFEMVWLSYLFSNPKKVFGNVTKISNLDVNINDIYQIQLEFKNKILCSLVLDVFSKPSSREMKILGNAGTLVCDFNSGIIKISKGKKWKIERVKLDRKIKRYSSNTPPDSIYEDELRNFFLAINKKIKYPYSLNDELKNLQVLDSIEKSSKMGRSISV